MKTLFIFLFLFPVAVFAQKKDGPILTSRLDTTSLRLAKNWKFKAGDNADWAMANLDDSAWQAVKTDKDGNICPLTDAGVIWLRRIVTTDSTLTKQLVLRIYQTGASEIYLDGKLIHKLGVISANPGAVKYCSPRSDLLSFPLKYNTKQVLAIRFANSPSRFPLYYSLDTKSFLYVNITTLDNAVVDSTAKSLKTYFNRANVTLGVAIVLALLYLSFFIFFPAQKINLYFSLSNFIFAGYMILQVSTDGYHGRYFVMDITAMTLEAMYVLLQLYCTYRIFEQKIGFIYWSIFAIGLLSILAMFFLDASVVGIGMAVLSVMEMFRISILSLRKNKTGALIIIIAAAISALFWVLYFLTNLGLVNIPGYGLYQPLGLMIGPLSLAIYLGYAFGMTSMSLRQKLTEVEQLSTEKQEILLAQNETLEQQVTERTAELSQSLNDLKSTQTQLVQREKMASLGELTAGIAHEIQNPLNFINNFSEVNKEMLEELKAESAKPTAERDDQLEGELINDLIDNEEKINHHGKRADSIVKNMLEHSRSASGQKESTNINQLADEYLRLSYHGLRAKDKNFNVELITHFDPDLPKMNMVQQDIGRVLLNLFNNAFYAVNQKQKTGGADYKPEVSVTTSFENKQVIITVKDNGTGIPDAIKEKIMQPFFTTKPTGEGTGLGLSLTYDMVVKGHGGSIQVNSIEGEGAEFIISLPFS